MKIMNKKGSWKAIAIIFIILFILQSLTFGFIVYVGMQAINRENECKFICSEEDADSFTFDEGLSLCECYRDNKIFYSERMK